MLGRVKNLWNIDEDLFVRLYNGLEKMILKSKDLNIIYAMFMIMKNLLTPDGMNLLKNDERLALHLMYFLENIGF